MKTTLEVEERTRYTIQNPKAPYYDDGTRNWAVVERDNNGQLVSTKYTTPSEQDAHNKLKELEK